MGLSVRAYVLRPYPVGGFKVCDLDGFGLRVLGFRF